MTRRLWVRTPFVHNDWGKAAIAWGDPNCIPGVADIMIGGETQVPVA